MSRNADSAYPFCIARDGSLPDEAIQLIQYTAKWHVFELLCSQGMEVHVLSEELQSTAVC